MTQGNRQVSLYFLENVRDKTPLLVMTKAQQFEKNQDYERVHFKHSS